MNLRTKAVAFTMMMLVGVGSSGCASAPEGAYPPVSRKRVLAALAMIKRAESSRGATNPRAGELRKMAWKWYDEAKAMSEKGDTPQASFTLLRAEADAELAIAYAETTLLEQQASQADAKLAARRAGASAGAGTEVGK